MSENIWNISNGWGDETRWREQVQPPVLTTQQEQMIQSDPRLRELNSSPDTASKTQGIISDNPQVFTAIDNPAVKNQLLGDMGIASNGMKFADMEKMSPEERKALPFPVRIEFNKWKKEQLDQAVVSKTNEWKILDKENLSKKDEWSDLDKAIIEWQEKEKVAKNEVEKIQSTLSDTGKTLIESEFKEAKSNTNNPVYRDLISKGISPNKWDFDNILRASIVLANAEILKKESNNQDLFSNSLRELGKLGIPYPVKSDIPSISTHIDSRFPKWKSTERAKWEIAHSITSGNVASIYYDGKWEKYTLIDKDGKTSKEVYMNPPRIRVAQNGFEAEEAIVPSEDTKKRVDKQNELWVIKGKTQEKIGKIWADLYGVINGDNSEYKDIVWNPILQKNFSTLADTSNPITERQESADKLIKIYREARDTPTINKDLYDRKIQELDEIKRWLQEEIKLQWVIASLPITSSEDFEHNVKENFTTLSTDPRLYNRFPRPQELITGILDEINRTRDTRNQIQLGEKVLWPSEKRSIDEAYEKVLKYIGTDSSILKSAEIGKMQPRITELLRNNNRELKKILANTEWQKSETK